MSPTSKWSVGATASYSVLFEWFEQFDDVFVEERIDRSICSDLCKESINGLSKFGVSIRKAIRHRIALQRIVSHREYTEHHRHTDSEPGVS